MVFIRLLLINIKLRGSFTFNCNFLDDFYYYRYFRILPTLSGGPNTLFNLTVLVEAIRFFVFANLFFGLFKYVVL